MFKKFLILFVCIITGGISAFALDDGLKFDRTYAYQIQKERATVSNALILSPEQTELKNQIAMKYSRFLDEKFEQLSDANIALKIFKAQNAPEDQISYQEKTINNIKKDIKDLIEEENEEFKKILDRDQRAKLRMIQKLQRKAFKEADKNTDYYKKNPKMREFAPQI